MFKKYSFLFHWNSSFVFTLFNKLYILLWVELHLRGRNIDYNSAQDKIIVVNRDDNNVV